MKKLRILMYAGRVGIDNKNKGFFKFLVPILDEIEKKFLIEEIWIGPYGGSDCDKYQKNVKDYNIFNFHDSVELLQKLKPDLILMTSKEYITISLLIAAKHEGIKSVLLEGNQEDKILGKMNFMKLLFLRLRQSLFEDKLFLKKYVFFIRTFRKSKYDVLSIFQIIFKDIKFHLTSLRAMKITNLSDLHICTNFEAADNAIKLGTDKNRVIVVGDFALDHIYDRFSNLQNPTQNKKIEILFITSGLAEHGIWSYKQHKEVVTNVVKALKNNLADTTNLKFKIHPLSEKIERYQEILASIDPTIEIFQDADLSLLISKSDLIISYVQTTALMEAILLKKPIFFINFFDEHFPMVKDNVAKEFKNTDELISAIQDGSFSKIKLDIIQKYLKKKIHKFDGKCGERAAMHILSLFNN